MMFYLIYTILFRLVLAGENKNFKPGIFFPLVQYVL